jgi:hypothetical protein
VYKQDGADTWIEYLPGLEQWQLKPGSDKGTDKAWMASRGAQKEAGVVEDVTAGWMVADATKVWSEQAGVRVVRCVYLHKETRKTTWENPERSFFKFIDLRPYEHVLRDVLQALRKFLVKQSAMVGYEARLEMAGELFLHNRGDFLQENASRPSLEASVRLILLHHLLLPCVQGIGEKDPNTPFEFLPLPMPWLPCPAGFAAGASVFKEEKKLLEEKMQTCNEVKKSLRALC